MDVVSHPFHLGGLRNEKKVFVAMDVVSPPFHLGGLRNWIIRPNSTPPVSHPYHLGGLQNYEGQETLLHLVSHPYHLGGILSPFRTPFKWNGLSMIKQKANSLRFWTVLIPPANWGGMC